MMPSADCPTDMYVSCGNKIGIGSYCCVADRSGLSRLLLQRFGERSQCHTRKIFDDNVCSCIGEYLGGQGGGDAHCGATCCTSSLYTRDAVLEHHAIGRYEIEPFAGFEEYLGVGFAVRYVVGTDTGCNAVVQIGLAHDELHVDTRTCRAYGALYAAAYRLVEQRVETVGKADVSRIEFAVNILLLLDQKIATVTSQRLGIDDFGEDVEGVPTVIARIDRSQKFVAMASCLLVESGEMVRYVVYERAIHVEDKAFDIHCIMQIVL